ncbi:MAG: nucleoside triphosphate pyrophosphatase [Vicinamibacterales bacterium]
MPKLLLASQSPRRAQLLEAAGFPFEALPSDVDESVLPGETPEAHVVRLAELKARTGLSRRPEAVVLGADTVVVVDGRILGKPVDDEEARRMVGELAGRSHEVLTGVAVASATGVTSDLARTTVWFTPLTTAEIEAYVATGEPRDKAGAYGIQGRAACFVERIDGSHPNVVGLPIALVYRLLAAAGVSPADETS